MDISLFFGMLVFVLFFLVFEPRKTSDFTLFKISLATGQSRMRENRTEVFLKERES